MTGGRRIVLNIAATYGRSLYALALGLFSARWILAALGQVDFGLYGVVGSIIVFITFFNGVLGTSVARFYAYVIGQGEILKDAEARELLISWFNTALSVHIVIAAVLISIGYPIGIHAIYHWLTIPVERIETCVWVFRLSLLTAFVGMTSVPFIAMYTAHQYIAELSLWGVLNSSLLFGFAYILQNLGGDRLFAYALAMMVIHAGISVCQCVRSVFVFRACRLSFRDWFDFGRCRRLFGFAGWQFFGNCGALMRGQACTILTNVYFGPAVNAAYAISNQVLSHTGTLAQAMIGAFTPAITTAEGAGDRGRMISMAWKTSRIGTYLILVFLLPLILEIDEVLFLWLKTPPEWTSLLCVVSVVDVIANKVTVGQQLAISAQGKIAKYQATLGTILILALPVAWGFVLLGCGPMSVVLGLIITTIACSLGRVYFGWRQLKMEPMVWLKEVVFRVAIYMVLTLVIGYLPHLFMEASFLRVCVTALFTFACAGVLGWVVIFEQAEREKILGILGRYL